MGYKKTPQLTKLLLCFLLLCGHGRLFAQLDHLEQSVPLPTPTENFPGYFDTNVTPKNGLNFSLPLGNFNYGITKNFTIGANFPLLFYMIDSWQPAFAISARYRFFSNKQLSSTVSAYGGYFQYADSSRYQIYFVNGTYNNSITINNKQYITTQLNALTVHYNDTDYDEGSKDYNYVNSLSLALGYTYIFNKKWSLQNIVAAPLIMNFYTKNSSFNSQTTFSHIQNYPVFYRLLAAWQIAPWSLITFGGFLTAGTTFHEIKLPRVVALPWIDWTVIF